MRKLISYEVTFFFMTAFQWKGREEVKALVVYPDAFDSGMFGSIHFGRIKFRGKRPKRVAVKIFDNPLSDRAVKAYERVIERLAKAGVRIPKTGFLKHEGRWVQVQSLFGSKRRGSVLTEQAPWRRQLDTARYLQTRDGKDMTWGPFKEVMPGALTRPVSEVIVREYAKQWGRITLAGLDNPGDSDHWIYHLTHPKMHTIDIDQFAYQIPGFWRYLVKQEYRFKKQVQDKPACAFGRPSDDLIRRNLDPEFLGHHIPERYHELFINFFFSQLPDRPRYRKLKEKILSENRNYRDKSN